MLCDEIINTFQQMCAHTIDNFGCQLISGDKQATPINVIYLPFTCDMSFPDIYLTRTCVKE